MEKVTRMERDICYLGEKVGTVRRPQWYGDDLFFEAIHEEPRCLGEHCSEHTTLEGILQQPPIVIYYCHDHYQWRLCPYIEGSPIKI